MLRDCRDEKRRLQEQIEIMRTRGNFTDQTHVRDLENRISELQSIIQAMQSSDSNISEANRNEINNLYDQLNKCEQNKNMLVNSIAQFSANTGMDVPII
jgi:DNA repair exonuclease SbcCD ATPase subunit